MSDTFNRQVTDERHADQPIEVDAEGLVARSAREDTPLAEMQLRESGEARAELIGLARAKFILERILTLSRQNCFCKDVKFCMMFCDNSSNIIPHSPP